MVCLRKSFRILAPLTVLFFMVVSTHAQVVTGSISGKVDDTTGAVVQGAVIRATNAATGVQSSATSDKSGYFKLSLLPIASYEVTVAKPQFKTAVFSKVQVTANTDYGMGTITLQVGAAQTTVEVTAKAPLLHSTQAQITANIGSKQMETFPGILEAEGLDNMTATLPGVANPRDETFSNSNGMDFSVNGLRSRNNDQQIDGENNNDNSVGGPSLFLVNPDFVQEYQVTTSNFGPEYGRNAGSVVNEITKRGTNAWHGSVAGEETNSILQTLSNTQKAFEGLTKLPRQNNEFTSATIGGPIWKNHVFLFGGFDDQIISSKTVYSSGSLTPDATGLGELASCYPGSASIAALQQFGPFGIGGGNPKPQGAPVTVTLLGAPNPNAGTDPNGNGQCNVEMTGVQRLLGDSFHEYDWIYRTDVVLSNTDRFYSRYLFNKGTSFNTDAFGTAAAGYPANIPALSQSFLLDETHTFTPEMVNEFRASFSRENVEFGGNSIGNTIPNQGQLGSAIASIGIALSAGHSFLGFGPSTGSPQGRIVNIYQLQDNWSFYQGRNQWKAGVNFTYQRSPNIFLPNFNGRYNFGGFSLAPGATFANSLCSITNAASNTANLAINSYTAFACDSPSSIQIAAGNPSLDFREYDTFLYAGDDYKLKNNVTLNLGLTWSYFGQPANLFNNLTVKNETGPTPLFNPGLPLSVRTFPSIPSVKDEFAPSVGFAWMPQWGGWLTGHGKTVLRGGYRLAYDPPFYNIYTNISTSTPVVLLQTLTGATAAANPLLADPTGTNVRSELASSLVTGIADPRSFNQTSITPNFGPDRVHEWSFGIQRSLGADAVFETRYVGNHAADLFQSINANPMVCVTDIQLGTGTTGSCVGGLTDFPKVVPAGVAPCLGPVGSANGPVVASASGRANCNEGVLRTRTNTGYSDYEGWQNELRTSSLFHQLTMRAVYTWSKTTDNSSEIFTTFGGGNTEAFSQNPFNYTGAEHGLSGLNFPQTFSLSAYEDLPFLRRQPGVIGHIFGGWGVAATYILQSGQAYTPIQYILNTFTNPLFTASGSIMNGNGYDTVFDNSFGGAGIFETARPFLGNPGAPVTSVGIYAADACSLLGVGCSDAANTLLDFSAANTTGAATAVSNGQVHFIVNGLEADTLAGTPFGNVARNSLKDARTNIANLSLFKNIRFNERVNLQWHMTMTNGFNHPNFSSVDPFVDDALKPSAYAEGTGFGVPYLTSGGNRVIYFGLKVMF